MAHGAVTFQVLEGIDRGRIYRELELPVTIGREEGNTLRLNDERVSRFHAKVQIDGDDYILAGSVSATASAWGVPCCFSAPTRKSPPASPAWPAWDSRRPPSKD